MGVFFFFQQPRSFLRSWHAQNTKLRKIAGKEVTETCNGLMG